MYILQNADESIKFHKSKSRQISTEFTLINNSEVFEPVYCTTYTCIWIWLEWWFESVKMNDSVRIRAHRPLFSFKIMLVGITKCHGRMYVISMKV